MCRFLKVSMAAFIMLLSISSLTEASFFSSAPKEDPQVAELKKEVNRLRSTIDELKQKVNILSFTIDVKNKDIDERREKLDSQNKIIEQQNERILEQEATIREFLEKSASPNMKCWLIGTFVFMIGLILGASLLFIGLQRRGNTQNKKMMNKVLSLSSQT